MAEKPRQARGEDREYLVRDRPQMLCPLRDRDALPPLLSQQRSDLSLERLRHVGDIDQALVNRVSCRICIRIVRFCLSMNEVEINRGSGLPFIICSYLDNKEFRGYKQANY